MAEENVNSPIVLEKSESGGSISSENGCSFLLHDCRASFGSGDYAKNSRRNSTGKPSPGNRNQKVVPHYLRASTGSCHDFCKYGRKHAFEEKERHPLWKRTSRPPPGKQNFVVTKAQGKRKKSMTVKHRNLTDIMSPASDLKAAQDAVQSLDPPEIVKREVLTSKKFEVSSKQDLSGDKKMLKTENRKNTSSGKHSPSVLPPLMEQSKKKMNTFPQKSSPSVQPQPMKQLKKKMNTISEKRSSSVQPQLMKQSSSSYTPESCKKTQKTEKGMKVSPFLQPQPVTAKSSPSSHIPGGISGRGRRKDDVKSTKNIVVSKSPAKRASVTPTSSLSTRSSISRTMSLKAGKNRGSKLMSPPMTQNRTQKAEMEETSTGKVPERTLHVVETETVNILSEPTQDTDAILSLPSQSYPSRDSLSWPHSLSLSSHGEEEEEEEEEDGENEVEKEEEEDNGWSFDKAEDLISENNTTAKVNGIKPVEGKHHKTLRKGAFLPESKDSRAVKLKFRRGKVVDVQSENNGPRRLRFRRARITDENHDSKNEIKRKGFKKKGVDEDGKSTNRSDKKVVLRHQDMQERKDAQGLFNNVIEETASKLVESRKSKVKALVGAFETVISLQESKPST